MTDRKPVMMLAGFFALSIAACATSASSAPDSAAEDALKPCPDSPNCVSSLEAEGKHAIAPLVFTSSRADARQALLSILAATPGAKVVKETSGYVRAEFHSKVFGFVDDVEFLFPEDQRVIHVRSASRTGYYDFGANRKRVESLRRKLDDTLNP